MVKRERTDEALTAHGDVALLVEDTHALGLRALVARALPRPGSYRGYAPSVVVETSVLHRSIVSRCSERPFLLWYLPRGYRVQA